jgi:protocatechuate 3,4-dioxygenase, beta subunit
MEHRTNRRRFLGWSLGLTAGALAGGSSWSRAFAASCGLTPPQAEGPFYPGATKFLPENDLTLVAGAPRSALGEVVFLKGTVMDSQCKPLADANVEIWQACASGRYNHSRDPNPAPIDPYFKYWGEAFTNERGEYDFKTIIPGAYPAASGWTRPPHIHFRVAKLGYQELITQMYFAGEKLNAEDRILRSLSPADRAKVTVEFKGQNEFSGETIRVGRFDITMMPVPG